MTLDIMLEKEKSIVIGKLSVTELIGANS